MTPTEFDAVVQNLNHRVTRMEQILPTLATRDDLTALARELREELVTKRDLAALAEELRQELAARFDDAKRYTLVLHEDLKSDIRLIAERLSAVMSRLPPLDR